MMPALLDRFPTLELHIVGEGSCRSDLQRAAMARGVGSSVKFHGALPARDRDALLASAWMSINASAAEGWGISVIEANALGVPVLAVRKPGLRDSIRDGETGWLVADESQLTGATAQALEALASPEVAAEWSRRTRAWASRFSWDEMADRVLRTVLAEHARLERDDSERRLQNDAVTLVHVPTRLVPENWNPRLRIGDSIFQRPDGRLLVLAGSDTARARTALIRSGMRERTALDPAILCSVARPSDLLLAHLPGDDALTETTRFS
jgi:hypothetical protein